MAKQPPSRAWVARIRDPKQRVLAEYVPEVCAIFGLAPEDLVGLVGARAESDDQNVRANLRGLAIGAVVDLGRALGLRWHDLHDHKVKTRVNANGEHVKATIGAQGVTKVRDLHGTVRSGLVKYRGRFAAFAGLDVNDHDVAADAGPRPHTTRPALSRHHAAPIGELGNFARVRYEQVRADALLRLRSVLEHDEAEDEVA